jgi:hypothetical protein
LEQVNSSNISNPTMRTGLDFKSEQFDHVRGEAEDWIGMRGLEIYSPVRIGEFEMTSRTNKWLYLINLDPVWIYFDPVQGQDQYTSSGIQYYHVSKIRQYGWLIYSWIINKFEMYI